MCRLTRAYTQYSLLIASCFITSSSKIWALCLCLCQV